MTHPRVSAAASLFTRCTTEYHCVLSPVQHHFLCPLPLPVCPFAKYTQHPLSTAAGGCLGLPEAPATCHPYPDVPTARYCNPDTPPDIKPEALKRYNCPETGGRTAIWVPPDAGAGVGTGAVVGLGVAAGGFDAPGAFAASPTGTSTPLSRVQISPSGADLPPDGSPLLFFLLFLLPFFFFLPFLPDFFPPTSPPVRSSGLGLPPASSC